MSESIVDGRTADGRPGHVVIVGCGRVGSGLARRLHDAGHTVAVIDADASAFRRLRDLDVQRVEGIGFDRATLIHAGVERATGAAAVTNGDNTNIVVARTAREAFRVRHVLARIFDVRRAAIYERLGIPTIASAQLSIELALRQLRPEDDRLSWLDPSARVGLLERPAPEHLIGRRAVDVDVDGLLRIVALHRLGSGLLVTPELVIQDGDLLYLAVANDRLDDVDRRLAESEGTR